MYCFQGIVWICQPKLGHRCYKYGTHSKTTMTTRGSDGNSPRRFLVVLRNDVRRAWNRRISRTTIDDMFDPYYDAPSSQTSPLYGGIGCDGGGTTMVIVRVADPLVWSTQHRCCDRIYDHSVVLSSKPATIRHDERR
jgi:hypothetical protein